MVTLTVDGRRILVVEDDQGTREFLAFVLTDAGHQVAQAGDGLEALAQAECFRPDLAVVDLGLPGAISGFDLARTFRRSADVGVIVLTGSVELADEEAALDAGADDFVTKPVSSEVLLARVRALLRRLRPASDDVHRFGALTIDDSRHVVTSGGERVEATPTEYRILLLLAHHVGRPLSKELLLGEIWGQAYVGDSHERRMVEVHVSRLRRKLEAAGGPTIHAVRGAGYVLRDRFS